MAYFYSPFRKKYTAKARAGCPFCEAEIIERQTVRYGNGSLVENEYYRWVVNFYPKFEGHTMIVPKRHVTIFGDEKQKEVLAREELIKLAGETLKKIFPGSGLEIFLQTGAGSESSIRHLHWHVVPASPDDQIRGFDKLGQFVTQSEEEKERVLIFPVRIKRSPLVLKRALEKQLAKGE